MRKMNTFSMKIGAIILLFSMIITVAFSAMLSVFSNGFREPGVTAIGTVVVPAQQQSIYTLTLSAEDAEQLFVQGTYSLNPESLVPIETYNNSYLEYLMTRIMPYAFCFCLLIFALSLGLWAVLKRVQAKNDMLVVNQLRNIEDIDAFSAEDPALLQAYESIKQKFDDNLRDYQRLNSYLSHEQKNAIAILRTRLELAEQQEYLPELDAISESIDDVLTLSETRDVATKAPVDVALVCATVCDSYKTMQDTITFIFDEDADTEIIAKERWIYRAVANLVANAVKYGEGKPIEVKVENKKHSVIVSVKDHGIGISPEAQEKIFNHRYRINELNKDGYGIGLSLVSHVCDLCGGFATVESELGEGSTFYLSFPQKAYQS